MGKILMLGTRVKTVRKNKEGKQLKGKITSFIKDKNDNPTKYIVELDDGTPAFFAFDDVVKEDDP